MIRPLLMGAGAVMVITIIMASSTESPAPAVSDSPVESIAAELPPVVLDGEAEAVVSTVDVSAESASAAVQQLKPLIKSSEPDTVAEPEVIYYQVVKVVDGDTITVRMGAKNETIRLIGINTPETVDPRKTVECFGVEASNKAKELLSGQRVSVELDDSQGERDKYGRLLAYIRRDNGLFVNKFMIEEGYAYEYTYAIPYQYQVAFKQAQADAEKNQKGLWAPDACVSQTDTAASSETIKVPVAPVVIVPSFPATTNYSCSADSYNCSDFSTQISAQSVFDACGGVSRDIHRLDADKDGVACESLP